MGVIYIKDNVMPGHCLPLFLFFRLWLRFWSGPLICGTMPLLVFIAIREHTELLYVVGDIQINRILVVGE